MVLLDLVRAIPRHWPPSCGISTSGTADRSARPASARKTPARPGLASQMPIAAKTQNGSVTRMISAAPTRSNISLHSSSHDSSGVERSTSIGLLPSASNTGRAICVRMNEAAIHASTPCSSQASTARATLSNCGFLRGENHPAHRFALQQVEQILHRSVLTDRNVRRCSSLR